MRFLNPSLHRPLIVISALLILAGCVPQRGKREQVWPWPEPPRPSTPHTPPMPPAQPAPTTPAPLPGGEPPATTTIPAEPPAVAVPPPAPNVPRSAEAISGQAVTSLVRQARSQRAAGQPQQAQALLERAQRIEPRNYFVWSGLAQTYLDQKNYDQAESVAQKSNSLARGNAYVELENWKTIRAARAARGDAAGAEQAEAHIQALQQALGVGG